MAMSLLFSGKKAAALKQSSGCFHPGVNKHRPLPNTSMGADAECRGAQITGTFTFFPKELPSAQTHQP